MGIQTFITFMFWLMIASCLMRAVLMCATHPRTVKVEIGTSILSFVFSLFLLIWVCYLKFFV